VITIKGDIMTVSIIGGLDRLKRDYINAGKNLGIKTKVVLKKSANVNDILSSSDAIILLTGNIAHGVAGKARSLSRQKGVPMVQVHKKPSINVVENALQECIEVCTGCKCEGDCSNCEVFLNPKGSA